MIAANMSFELDTVDELRAAIKLAESKKDYISREALDNILNEQEEQIDWLPKKAKVTSPQKPIRLVIMAYQNLILQLQVYQNLSQVRLLSQMYLVILGSALAEGRSPVSLK